MLLRRTKPKPPVFGGYTDAAGYKTADAPKKWPFGKKHRVVNPAQPKNPTKVRKDHA